MRTNILESQRKYFDRENQRVKVLQLSIKTRFIYGNLKLAILPKRKRDKNILLLYKQTCQTKELSNQKIKLQSSIMNDIQLI